MKMFGASLFTALLIAAPAFSGTITYNVVMSGLLESPPNASLGGGSGTVTIDTVTNMMALSLSFSGLTGTTTASHLHCCTAVPNTGTAGVATTTPSFAGFPLGVTSGTFSSTLDLTAASSYNSAFIIANGGTTASAEAVLLAGIAAGEVYWNVHSTVVPGGEIRGFLVATPEPATFGLVGAALLAGFLSRRRLA